MSIRKNEMRLRAESRVDWKYKHKDYQHFDSAEYETMSFFEDLEKRLDCLDEIMGEDTRLDVEMFGSIHYAIGIIKDYMQSATVECEEDIEKFNHEYYEVEGGYND